MHGLLDDTRQALRSLLRSPALTVTVAVTLALGIGATTAIFSAVHSLILRPLPFRDADRLVEIWRSADELDFRVTPTEQEAELWKAEARSFEQVEPWHIASMTLTGRGDAEQLTVGRITATFPSLIGMAPALGRAFTPEETQPGGDRVVMLGNGLWRSRFGGDPGVLGQTVTLDGEPHVVVGVAPPGFAPPSLLGATPEAYVPLVLTDAGAGLRVAARLAEGVTLEQAASELELLRERDEHADEDGMRWTGEVVRPVEFLGSRLKDGVVLLMVAVSLLLLIACINISNLLLSRAHGRQRETAVRAALGASRGRLLRQMLVESTLLSLSGGALGVLAAAWMLDALVALRPERLEVLGRVSLDGAVLAFAAAVALVTGLVFGLLPAFQASGSRALESLRSGSRTDESGAFGRRFRMGLVAAEVALSFALLAGAGLLVRTVTQLGGVDPGFQADGLVAAFVDLPEWRYGDAASRSDFAETLKERVAALPAVRAVALASGVPPQSGVTFGAGLEVEGGPEPGPDAPKTYFGNEAGPDYFQVLGQPLVAGRGFTEQEIRDEAPVWVLGEATARRLFGDEEAVGRRVRFSGSETWHTVVGVARDVRLNGFSVFEDDLQLYGPLDPSSSYVLIVRTTGDATTLVDPIRQLAAGIDPDVPVRRVATVASMMRGSVARQRFIMVLLVVFAGVAAVLAAIGLYGVLSSLVGRRTREIGIRMSLGADPGAILGMVLRQGAGATVLGLAAGLGIALAGARIIASQLYGVGRFDPLTYGVTAALLVAIALLAAWLPARRAASVDPVEAMRAE